MPDTLQYDRLVLPDVHTALDDTRVVVLQGARQVGKSTLAEEIAADRDGLLVTLDNPGARAFATDDPVGFVNQYPDGLLLIDEVQRVPELVIAVKEAVDRDKRPGRFLLTGSANLLDLAATHESLAGRAETHALYPLSRAEIEAAPGSFIDAVMESCQLRRYTSDLTREDYLDVVCAGGYPEALSRQGRRRRDWYQQYVQQIVNRDAVDISGLHRLRDLPTILRLIAARSGSPMVWSGLAADAGMPRRTLDPYVRLLESLYLVHTLPAWSTNLTSRVTKQPKLHVVDTGLAAALLQASADSLHPAAPGNLAGALLESFVVGELVRQATWSAQDVSLSHFRSNQGEIDVILEAPDGRIVGIEVKAAATVSARDVRHLATLRDKLGERFVGGVVLYTGREAVAVGGRILALPTDALWRWR